MRETVSLEAGDVREIIAKFLGIPLEAVVKMKYSYEILGVTADEIRAKLGRTE